MAVEEVHSPVPGAARHCARLSLRAMSTCLSSGSLDPWWTEDLAGFRHPAWALACACRSTELALLRLRAPLLS